MEIDDTQKEILSKMSDAVFKFDEEKAESLCKLALEKGIDPYIAINEGLALGMKRAGDLYESGEYFVPELLLCSDAMYAGLNVLQPHVKLKKAEVSATVVIGVVEGDIHDIGKNIVKTMLVASGFKVIDLGNNVRLQRFIEEQRKNRANVIALSTLTTTGLSAMQKCVKMLRDDNPDLLIIVGGAPLTREIAISYNADGYAPDASAAVRELTKLLKNKRNNK